MAGKGKVGARKKPISGSKKAGVIFPVGRTSRLLKEGRYADRIGQSGPIFLAGVLEYLASEILEISGDICAEHNKKTIQPRHIQLAVRNDDELNKMMAVAQISQGGVLPNVSDILFPKKGGKGKKADATQEA